MVRKFLFSICAVIIGPLGSDLQAYCGLAVLMAFLQLQNSLTPYDSEKMNLAETVGLITQIVTLLLGLSLNSKNASTTAVNVFGSFIILINVSYILYTMYVFYRAIKSIREMGLMTALGVKSLGAEGGSFRSLKHSLSKSAIPQVEDVFSDKSQSRGTFDSDHIVSMDINTESPSFTTVNPVYFHEQEGFTAHDNLPNLKLSTDVKLSTGKGDES